MDKGYMGKILRIDLTKEKMEEESLPEEAILKKYVGCVGLGMKFLFDEVSPKIQPLDPENRLIFMTGPLTGTRVPSSSNWTVVTLNHNFSKVAATSHSHGVWGVKLKLSGYDGLIIQGKAKKPVYLHIRDGKAELRDATKFWGLDTHETEDAIKEELGDIDSSIAAIGPAGENLCRGACIENDKNHLASKGGTGAVMGSKNLKAIAVSGKKHKISVYNREGLLKVVKAWMKRLPEGYFWSSCKAGITRKYIHLAERGVIAWKNMTCPSEGIQYGQAMVEAAKVSKVTPRPCFNCPIGCSYDIEIGSGPHKGYVATLTGGEKALKEQLELLVFRMVGRRII